MRLTDEDGKVYESWSRPWLDGSMVIVPAELKPVLILECPKCHHKAPTTEPLVHSDVCVWRGHS